MRWGPGSPKQITGCRKARAGRHGCRVNQKACLTVLLAEDGALSHRAVPPLPQCWWYRYQIQTREHLFKVCLEWKAQQKILWAEVLKGTGKWKSRWKTRDFLADGRCSQAVLDFPLLRIWEGGCRLRRTRGVRRRNGGTWQPEEDSGREVSEWERREREEERRAEVEELGAGGELPLFRLTPSFLASDEEE